MAVIPQIETEEIIASQHHISHYIEKSHNKAKTIDYQISGLQLNKNNLNTKLNFNKNENTHPVKIDDMSPENMANNDKFVNLSVGLNVGSSTVNESLLIRGFEDGSKAINFDNWLLPFDDVTKALHIKTTTLNDGQLELRSPGLVTRINPQELKTDPDLGLVISVGEIKKIGVPTEFNIVKYAIVFNPPWLGLTNHNNHQKPQSVVLEGLPKIDSQKFSFSTIGQNISITGNNNNISSQGDLTLIGTLFGSSWYVRTNQPRLNDIRTWNIAEAQYLHQTDSADYVVGSQPTFWQNQVGGQYWGFTTVQRFGYTPPTPTGSGFSPNQRMQSNQIERTIVGEAAPGTLVQLTQGFENDVVAEILVDSSGVYHFENIPTISGVNNTYHVRLYANGRLTATPEVREVNLSSLPSQLTKGTSTLMISSGFSRTNYENSFIGKFSDWRGGIAYRLGLTEDLTIGTGVVYDNSLLGLGEIFYQPKFFPLQVAFSSLLGIQKSIKYNASIRFKPSQNLDFNFNLDDLSQLFRINWQAMRGVSLIASGNSQTHSLSAGLNFSQTSPNFSLFTSVDIDTNNNLRWNLSSRLRNLQLSHQGNGIATNSQLSYIFDPGNSLNLNYETQNHNNLATFSWHYSSDFKTRYGMSLWELDLGYGVGSQGSGFIASANTRIIPGLNLRLRYYGISATSDSSIFRIELSPSDSRYESFRSQGGLLIQPFLDRNGNGRLDNNEKIYIEDTELLLNLNNKSIQNFQPDISKNGVLLKIPPGNYRLDLDPAGYPLDWKPTSTAYAVEVAAGGYTTIQIPFSLSYTVAGTLTNTEKKPVGGVKVEAIPQDKGKKIVSITNGRGIFFLENLQQGTYNLLVNDKPTEPEKITIDADSERIQEVNLKL